MPPGKVYIVPFYPCKNCSRKQTSRAFSGCPTKLKKLKRWDGQASLELKVTMGIFNVILAAAWLKHLRSLNSVALAKGLCGHHHESGKGRGIYIPLVHLKLLCPCCYGCGCDCCCYLFFPFCLFFLFFLFFLLFLFLFLFSFLFSL